MDQRHCPPRTLALSHHTASRYGIYDHKPSTFLYFLSKSKSCIVNYPQDEIAKYCTHKKVQQVCLTLILGRVKLTKFDIVFEFVLLTLLLCSVGILSVIAVMCLKSSLASPLRYIQVLQRVHCHNWIAAMAE